MEAEYCEATSDPSYESKYNGKYTSPVIFF